MKIRVTLLALAGALLLSGCTSMLERSYVSSATHLDYSVTEDESILRAETYQGLVNAILYFVNEHAISGTIRLYNYTGDVEADLVNACNEVLYEDPLGVFAVRTLEYDSTRILTYYEVDVRISYSRSAQTISSIQSVSGLSGLRQELTRAVASLRSQTVVRVSYFSGDAQVVEYLFWLAYYSTPGVVITPPEISVEFYPETGAHRIVELNIDWGTDTDTLTQYARLLDQSTADLLDTMPPNGDAYTALELAGLLTDLTPYASTGCSSALEALEGTPANDLGLLLAMEALCQQAGLEASMVLGSRNGTDCMWLIVSTDDGYRHLLPSQLRSGRAPELYTDAQLTPLGYSWSTALYPACSDYSLELGQ